MRHLNITYTSHFNRRHKRIGHLYQGRYKSFLVELDSYLSQASRYIVEEKTGTKNIFCSCGTIRQNLMTALYKYANLNNREIGALLGVDYSTVSHGRIRLRK